MIKYYSLLLDDKNLYEINKPPIAAVANMIRDPNLELDLFSSSSF